MILLSATFCDVLNNLIHLLQFPLYILSQFELASCSVQIVPLIINLKVLVAHNVVI